MLHEMIPNQSNASEHHTALHVRRHQLDELIMQLHVLLPLSVPFNLLNELYYAATNATYSLSVPI